MREEEGLGTRLVIATIYITNQPPHAVNTTLIIMPLQ